MNTEILGRIVTISNDIASIIISLLFFFGWLKRKDMDTRKFIGSLILIVALLVVGNQILQNSVLFLIMAMSVYTLIPLIYCKGKVWIRIASGFFFVSLGIVSELLAALVLSVFFQISIDAITGSEGLYLAGSLISRLILLLMVQGFLFFINKKAQWLSVAYWIMIVAMPILSMFITISLFYQADIIGIGKPLLLFSSIAVLYINLIAFWLFAKINSEYEKIMFMKAANQQLEMQHYYYGELQENYKATRGLWHDLRNNLLTIRGGLEGGNLEDVKKHIDSLLMEVEHPAAIHYSGNVVVDSLLYDKIRKAQQNNIKIDMEIRISNNLRLPPEDISTILGNALDNALEGCMRHRIKGIEKIIVLQLIEEKNNLLIYVKNTADHENIRLSHNKYLSSKKLQRDSGFGLFNMEKAVEKYGGNLKIMFWEGNFEVKILIPVL